jgi:Putative zinc-finger
MIEPDLRCIEFVELVTDWAEGALDDVTVARFEEHLAFCTGCSEYVVQLRQAASVLHKLDSDAPPAEARDTLLRMFRDEPHS